jgi:muconate cycloisomerase
VVEDLEVKRNIVREIEKVVSEDCVIGSNTSALPISLLQDGMKHPERIVGLHWAEPANLTRFLEIICGESTSLEIAQDVMKLAESWGKDPILVRRDIRGFVANRIGYAMLREAISLVERGIATPQDVDRALKNSIGSWMAFCGPFRMMDILSALPSLARVIPDLWPDLDNSTALPDMLKTPVQNGAHGIGSGRGFYEYSPEEAQQWQQNWEAFNLDIYALSQKYSSEKIRQSTPEKPSNRKISKSQIRSIRATPVRVPANSDSLDSPEIEADDPAYVAKYNTGASFRGLFEEIKWIIELESDDGCIGWGETYRAVSEATVVSALRPLLNADVLDLNWRDLPGEYSRAYDGVEAAVMDLAGKTLGVPVHQLLGGACRTHIECSGWTGRRTPKDAARKALEALHRGHRVFKFKCSDSDPVHEWLDEIRAACGDKIQVLLDPNGRWVDEATTRRLMENVPRDLMAGLEDPIDRQDYPGYRALRESLGVPIFLHVALPYRHMGQRPQDLLMALREYSADGFNFNGSMWEFVRLSSLAELDEKPVWHGSEVDLGILEAAYLHAAAVAPNCTLPSDIFGTLVRENDLLENSLEFKDGSFAVPNGPGLGVDVSRVALEKYRAGKTLEIRL